MVRVDDEHPGVEVARRDEALERPARRPLVRPGERVLGRRALLQDVAPSEEAVPADRGRGVAEHRIVRERVGQVRLQLARPRGRIVAGVDRDAAVDAAPGRHRRGPVAPLDAPDVEVDRMRLVAEVGVAVLLRVPARFEHPQRRDDARHRLDRARARARLAHVHRASAHLDGEPEHADVRPHELLVLGLRDDGGVGGVARDEAVQRAVARALLLDDALDVHPAPPAAARCGAARRARRGSPRAPPSCRPAPRP